MYLDVTLISRAVQVIAFYNIIWEMWKGFGHKAH